MPANVQLLQPPSTLSPSATHFFLHNTHLIPSSSISLKTFNNHKPSLSRSLENRIPPRNWNPTPNSSSKISRIVLIFLLITLLGFLAIFVSISMTQLLIFQRDLFLTSEVKSWVTHC